MSNKKDQQNTKPGAEQDRQRDQQASNPESAEQPGSPADVAKEKRRG